MKRGDMTDGIFLLHIADALQDAIDFTAGIESIETFIDDRKTVRAVMASFEIAGEATKNLTQEFRAAHPEIAWRDMSGFRDVLIHGYFGIDESRLWSGAKDFAPATIELIKGLSEYQAALQVY